MENIIETRYLNIFRFFHSKYFSPVSILSLQRFNSDSHACSSSFCGIASSARVVTVLMVEISTKRNILLTSIQVLRIERNPFLFHTSEGKVGNIRIPSPIVSSPCSAYEKCYVLVDVVVPSIDRRTDHFCCFAPGPEIAFPFTLCKDNSMLTERGSIRFPTRMI